MHELTFGTSRSAKHLAQRLTELDDAVQTSKVSSCIEHTNALINDAVFHHAKLGMSDKLLYFILDNMTEHVLQTAFNMKNGIGGNSYDVLCCDLMCNVLRGRIKSAKHALMQTVRANNRLKSIVGQS